MAIDMEKAVALDMEKGAVVDGTPTITAAVHLLHCNEKRVYGKSDGSAPHDIFFTLEARMCRMIFFLLLQRRVELIIFTNLYLKKNKNITKGIVILQLKFGVLGRAHA